MKQEGRREGKEERKERIKSDGHENSTVTFCFTLKERNTETVRKRRMRNKDENYHGNQCWEDQN